jgi:hypothetical protein
MNIKGFITKDREICGIQSDGSKLRLDDWLIKNHNQVVNINLSKERKKRTSKENNFYWGVIIKILGDFFGYTSQEMHDALKYQFLRIEIPGKPITIKSTADENFTTIDAEKYYEQIRQWAAREYGVFIPLPGEKVYE